MHLHMFAASQKAAVTATFTRPADGPGWLVRVNFTDPGLFCGFTVFVRKAIL